MNLNPPPSPTLSDFMGTRSLRPRQPRNYANDLDQSDYEERDPESFALDDDERDDEVEFESSMVSVLLNLLHGLADFARCSTIIVSTSFSGQVHLLLMPAQTSRAPTQLATATFIKLMTTWTRATMRHLALRVQ